MKYGWKLKPNPSGGQCGWLNKGEKRESEDSFCTVKWKQLYGEKKEPWQQQLLPENKIYTNRISDYYRSPPMLPDWVSVLGF